jgi:hypothetical protein
MKSVREMVFYGIEGQAITFLFIHQNYFIARVAGSAPIKRIKVMKKEVSCNGQFYVTNRVKLQAAAPNGQVMPRMAFRKS